MSRALLFVDRMFNRKTLVIVGAGASKEANLPTGDDLKLKIASLLDIQLVADPDMPDLSRQVHGDNVILQALKLRVQQPSDLDSYLHSAWHIRDAMPQAISIDNFIDTHSGNAKIELCGKLAIVRSILDAEKHSKLYFDKSEPNARPNFEQLAGTWYYRFMQLLTENCKLDDLSDRLSSVALIVFNYDRCIEHFLYHSLQNYYGIDPTAAANLTQKLRIYHPYGTVGHLPWQQSDRSVDFGEQPEAANLLALASQIRTFAEGTDPQASDIVAIRERLSESEIIVFLGFAFHRLNLQLLRPPPDPSRNPPPHQYFGTAIGISNNDCKLIRSDLQNLVPAAVGLQLEVRNYLTCSQLFHEYWRSLCLS